LSRGGRRPPGARPPRRVRDAPEPRASAAFVRAAWAKARAASSVRQCVGHQRDEPTPLRRFGVRGRSEQVASSIGTWASCSRWKGAPCTTASGAYYRKRRAHRIERSEELQDFVGASFKTYSRGDTSFRDQYASSHDGVRLIGSDLNEWFEGEQVGEVLKQEMQAGDVTVSSTGGGRCVRLGQRRLGIEPTGVDPRGWNGDAYALDRRLPSRRRRVEDGTRPHFSRGSQPRSCSGSEPLKR
jgi:hypothetical protein